MTGKYGIKGQSNKGFLWETEVNLLGKISLKRNKWLNLNDIGSKEVILSTANCELTEYFLVTNFCYKGLYQKSEMNKW